jgi:hypothetical protein
MTQIDRRKGEPSWGYLIALALVAVLMINLIAATFVLLLRPTPERYWVLGIFWVIALVGLLRLPRLLRIIESRPASPHRRPRA